MSAGKGSSPRPVNGDAFRANHEMIFGKRKCQCCGRENCDSKTPLDAAIRKTFTGHLGDVCRGFDDPTFLHGNE